MNAQAHHRQSQTVVLLLVGLLIFSCLTGAAQAQATAKPRLPNIVLILADDLGSGDLGCFNKDSRIPTPYIDRLAAEGMRCTDAHTPSSVCTPTRYGLLTGRYCWRGRLKQGVLQGYDPLLLEPGRLTLASLLQKHGYATGCVGKWHLGLGHTKPTDYGQPLRPGPQAVGFDYFFGIPASLDMPPYVFVENDQCVEQPTGQIGDSQMRRYGGNGFWRAGPIAPSFKHSDVLPTITRKAVAFMERHAQSEPRQPFFLYFPLTAPHTPWLPTPEFEGKSQAGWYGDFTMQVDATVGQVLAALDRLQLREQTLVIFTSDNGAHWLADDIQKYQHRANGPYRGQKADAWEGGHRVPLVARWPGHIKPGSSSAETICLTDLLATAAAIVGERLPDDAGEDSYNLLPVLQGRALQRPLREATVHHSGAGLFAIRQGPWKLIDGLGSGGFSQPKTEPPLPGGPTGQLYNLAEDVQEQHNLFLRHPDIVARLKQLLETYKTQGRSRP